MLCPRSRAGCRAIGPPSSFGVAIRTAIGWMQRVEETGSVAPGQMGGHRPKAISGEHAVWLSQRIKDGDFTIRGLVVELAGRGLKVDYHSVRDFVHAKKLSFKKSVAAGERDRPEIARQRAQWAKYQGRYAAGLHGEDRRAGADFMPRFTTAAGRP